VHFKKRMTLVSAALALLGGGLSACGQSGGPTTAASGGASGGDSLKIVVGRQPYAAGNSPVTQYMINNKLFEKAAEKAGQPVTVDWQDHPSAAPMVEAMVGGRMDFGMWGNTPILRAIAQKQPISVIGVGEGNMRFILATKADSGIHQLSDLKGKTVGLLVGGDPQLAFLGMLKQELQGATPESLAIKVQNLPTQAIAATVPQGVDATVVIYPALLKQQEKDTSVVGVLNSHGETEAAYQGSAGQGAGHELTSAQSSAFAPEGFYGHRSFWVARNEVIEKHPAVVSAFLAAEQQAVEALKKQSPEEVSNSVAKYWQLQPADGAKILNDEILFSRGWVWATQGDAILLQKLSVLMAANKIIDAPLTGEQVKTSFQVAATPAGKAYDVSGKKPDAEAFKPTAKDPRGLPQWQINDWSALK